MKPILQNQPTRAAIPNHRLKSCPACHRQIAKDTRTCPHCGKTFTTAGGVFVALLIGLILGGFFYFGR